eukprot:922913-Prorocentrum_minimum.AAC.2
MSTNTDYAFKKIAQLGHKCPSSRWCLPAGCQSTLEPLTLSQMRSSHLSLPGFDISPVLLVRNGHHCLSL